MINIAQEKQKIKRDEIKTKNKQKETKNVRTKKLCVLNVVLQKVLNNFSFVHRVGGRGLEGNCVIFQVGIKKSIKFSIFAEGQKINIEIDWKIVRVKIVTRGRGVRMLIPSGHGDKSRL